MHMKINPLPLSSLSTQILSCYDGGEMMPSSIHMEFMTRTHTHFMILQSYTANQLGQRTLTEILEVKTQTAIQMFRRLLFLLPTK